MRREPPTNGRKIFRPYTCGALLHWARTTIHGAAMEMVGRMDIIGTRRGEIFFARTSVVWGRIGRAPRFMAWRLLIPGRLRMDGARTGEKYFARTFMVQG